MQNDFINFIKERGFLYQCTNEEALIEKFNKKDVIAYIGFDCTANSLHIGSLVQIMFLRWLQKFGNKPIVLLGGGTTKIGDPSGKDKSRMILSEEDIKVNKEGIKYALSKFLTFDQGENIAIMADNNDWLSNVNYIEFLRDVGKHFSMNKMLEFESVKIRLEREQHLSFLEFNYMVLQGYDFVELNKRYGCNVEIGGSDQWGNIICGIDLGSKMHSLNLYGMTTPLITTSDGKKMGKTANGAVWLDENLYSPYDYWQYFRNISDADVKKFLYLFTELEGSEIEKLASLKNEDINEAKKILATEATAICHGRAIAEEVKSAAIHEFEKNDSKYLPSIKIAENFLFKTLIDIGFANSSADAKRKIKSGAVLVDDIHVNDINFPINKNSKISIGKKKILVEF